MHSIWELLTFYELLGLFQLLEGHVIVNLWQVVNVWLGIGPNEMHQLLRLFLPFLVLN